MKLQVSIAGTKETKFPKELTPAFWEIEGTPNSLMNKMIYNSAAIIAKVEFPDDHAGFETRLRELVKPYRELYKELYRHC
jgi:hypothetical protein